MLFRIVLSVHSIYGHINRVLTSLLENNSIQYLYTSKSLSEKKRMSENKIDINTENEAFPLPPSVETSSSAGIKGIAASDLEVDHVFRVYDNISVHWNHTRGKRKVHWPRIKTFIESLPKGALVAGKQLEYQTIIYSTLPSSIPIHAIRHLVDIGSGDGKYFGINPGIFSIGCDRSLRLLEVSRSPEFETFCCDAVKLPFVRFVKTFDCLYDYCCTERYHMITNLRFYFCRLFDYSDMFDASLCIAVMHHLASTGE